ncbi:hypothetical protein jhhlp_001704 [Lomentospora prolificans]|uniref:Heterokaryon incompatibility domain-containing protein n=1 Tax=Lomentospora prolificans TaxID=41688 RepID=A0A2N3NGX1_9PEZI|nr:hypothetical protein jhhlp_001704 [Lomentospora prolificans]
MYKVLDTFSRQIRLPTPTYRALSYIWGDANDVEAISTDGTAFQATVVSARLCVISARKPNRITVWVYAVCINQNDNAEKSTQVPLIRAVYAGAEKVLVWLGGEGDDSHVALRLIWLTKILLPQLIQQGIPQEQVFHDLMRDLMQLQPLCYTHKSTENRPFGLLDLSKMGHFFD